jgi:hypothetical protein
VIVCNRLKERGEQLDYCIVGEPTSTENWATPSKMAVAARCREN